MSKNAIFVAILAPERDEERPASFQGGGQHAQEPSASQHREVLRLLGGAQGAQDLHLSRQEVDRHYHRTHDLGNPQEIHREVQIKAQHQGSQVLV